MLKKLARDKDQKRELQGGYCIKLLKCSFWWRD
jgi:hypothetical protein